MSKKYFNLSEITFQPISNHPTFKNLTGKRFSKLLVIGFGGKETNINRWFCKCDCGNIVKIRGEKLRSKWTKSCGCLVRLHGEGNTRNNASPEFKTYANARNRCQNPKNSSYVNYGGRGIEFRFNSFEEFLNEVGRKPTPQHSIERIDVNGHYEKGNVCWATMKEQQTNRANNKQIIIDGITRCESEWIAIFGIKQGITAKRRKLGWCDACSVKLPVGKKCIHR